MAWIQFLVLIYKCRFCVLFQLGWCASATESNSKFEDIDLTDKVSVISYNFYNIIQPAITLYSTEQKMLEIHGVK